LQDSVVREAERGILEETDYLKEAQNIEHFPKAARAAAFCAGTQSLSGTGM
jgi:predicted unusual protein kinase regulating ubiquinone biosynthesis (AarF/ABC1/UbiB family)